jgi:ankyrin repeat protein
MANRRQAIALLVSEWPEQLNIVDFKRQSASMFAAQQRDSETLQMLLKAGADVNLQDYTGRTVLHGAVTGGSVECLAAVLERQPDRQLVTAEEGNTPLHTAVKMGLPGIVRPLIEYAPEWVQAKNTFDFTPLEFAEKIVIRTCPPSRLSWPSWAAKSATRRDYEECLPAALSQHDGSC